MVRKSMYLMENPADPRPVASKYLMAGGLAHNLAVKLPCNITTILRGRDVRAQYNENTYKK